MQPNNKVRNDPLDVDYDPHAARLQQQQQQQQIQRRRDRPIPPPPPAAPSVRPNLTSQPELQQQIPHKQQEEKQQDKHSEQVQQIKDSAALIYSAWTAHVNPSGTPYYFNSVTNQSVWERPACLPLAEFPTASHKNFTQELQSETGIIGLQDISEQSDKQPQEEIILHERAIAM
ncbi:hypothetical protein HK100_012678 [Physocladia obscura]|uniref:WW domain-containing protein n=1 Tax=Physocladia obscura TaxID=109957 RepID=A0AAD5T158_9FUNG|nr:hypothetical protein HK100_012678 [Physocladia obscura]